jgi:hypothetical protein
LKYSVLLIVTCSVTWLSQMVLGQEMGNAKNSCSCVLANKTCRPKNSLLLPQLEAQDPLLLSVVVDIENNPLLKNVNGNGTLITDVLINHWLSKRTAADTLSRQIEEGQYAVVIDYYFNLSELEGGPGVAQHEFTTQKKHFR